jgi:hypothetical protein
MEYRASTDDVILLTRSRVNCVNKATVAKVHDNVEVAKKISSDIMAW